MSLLGYIGLPYKDKGRDVNGLDCWGLVRLFYDQELNVKLPSYVEEYREAHHQESVSKALSDHKDETWIRVDNPTFGDVVLFRVGGAVFHVGIILDHKNMLHILKGSNSVIERYKSVTWEKRIEGFYRWPISQ